MPAEWSVTSKTVFVFRRSILFIDAPVQPNANKMRNDFFGIRKIWRTAAEKEIIFGRGVRGVGQRNELKWLIEFVSEHARKAAGDGKSLTQKIPDEKVPEEPLEREPNLLPRKTEPLKVAETEMNSNKLEFECCEFETKFQLAMLTD
jgi:hypothetical protein